MKAKSIVSAVLLLFVAASVVYLVVSESQSRPEADRAVQPAEVAQAAAEGGATESAAAERDEGELAAGADDAKKAEHKLIAYYFHGDVRCKTCLTIEEYAREALTDGFPEAIASGELEWRAVNFDEAGNRHFVLEYELTTSSLVLVDTEDSEQTEWKNLERVWDLVGDKWEFQAYVVGEALAYLENGP